MKKCIKNKPPSRVRYEQANPTVSCRVSKEVYDKLREVMDSEGKSFADILKIGLKILKVKMQKEEEIREAAYQLGYSDAKLRYSVTYKCDVCGNTLTVTSENEKQAINSYMREHNWGHSKCHEKNR